MKVKLVNNRGIVKKSKVGFSWTIFFFGCIVPLIRGDIKNFIILLLLQMLTFGFAAIAYSFFYNKMYINMLLDRGYIPYTQEDEMILVIKEFIARKN